MLMSAMEKMSKAYIHFVCLKRVLYVLIYMRESLLFITAIKCTENNLLYPRVSPHENIYYVGQ